jgi:hypothetical protein
MEVSQIKPRDCMSWIRFNSERKRLERAIVIPKVAKGDPDAVPRLEAIRVNFHRANEVENSFPSVTAKIAESTLLTKHLNGLRFHVITLGRALD